MTTFDRYILRQYWHVFVISFMAMMGLYIVIDAFSNVDEFFGKGDASTLEVMGSMARYYGLRSIMFFDSIGNIVSVTAVTVVLSLVLRHGELNPVLSAGIPTYRLAFPLLWGVIMVAAVMIANKELVLPRIANQLQVDAGKTGEELEGFDTVRDYSTMIEFSGSYLVAAEKKMTEPAFVLPSPEFSREMKSLNGSAAYFLPADPAANRPRSGWLIKDSPQRIEELQLTPLGLKTIKPGANPGEIFVVSDVSFDMLFRPDDAANMISTPELVRRIKSTAYNPQSARQQTLQLHQRLTRPLQDIVAVFLVLPLVVRREARGLVVSMALSGLAMGFIFGVSQGCLWLANANMISPDLAAWGPVMVAGSLATWFWPVLRT